MAILKFLFNILLLIDLALNTVLLGDPSETVSSRLGRAMISGKPKWFVPTFAKFVDTVFLHIEGKWEHSVRHIEEDENFEQEIWSWIK